MGQIDAGENSGSISVNAGNADKPQFALVWERRREGVLRVRAGTAPPLALPELETFFDDVNGRSRERAIEYVYRRRTLEYHGLAWKGEFWLDERLRAGPAVDPVRKRRLWTTRHCGGRASGERRGWRLAVGIRKAAW